MLNRTFLKTTFIQILVLLAAMIGLLVDSVFIGRYMGVTCVAAYGLCAPLLTFFSAIGGTLATGAQNMCSRLIGEGKIKNSSEIMSLSMAVGFVITGIATLLAICFAERLALILGAAGDAKLMEVTVSYIRGYMLGAPGLVLTQIALPFMQLDSEPQRAVWAAGAMTIGDIILDYVNTFILNGGMFGMGLASAISVYMALFVLLIHFFSKKYLLKICRFKFDKKLVFKIISIGLPYALSMVCRTVLVVSVNRLILMISQGSADNNLAAYSVVNTIYNAFYCLCSAVGSTTMLLSGLFFGEKNKSLLHETLYLMVKYGILLDLILAVIVWPLAPYLVPCFLNADAAAMAAAIKGVRFIITSLILASVSSGFMNYFMGAGFHKRARLVCFFQIYVFVILPACILVRFFGMTGIWLSFIAADVILLAFIFIFAYIIKGHIPCKIRDFDFLKNEIELPDVYFEADVDGKSGSDRITKDVNLFLKENNYNLRIGSAIEKYLACILEKRTEKINVKGQIRLYPKEGRLYVHLRDNRPELSLYNCISDERTFADERGFKIEILNSMDLSHAVLSFEQF